MRIKRASNRLIALGLLFVAAFVVAMCGCGEKEQRADFIFENGTDVETLDPALLTGQPEGRISMALFEGVTAFGPKGTEIVPGVAESWDISEDGLHYTFHLRDCLWSDGTPVTSEDFVYSWERALSPATGASYAYFLFCIVGAEEFNSGGNDDFSSVGIRAPDSRTIEVDLKDPTPFFTFLTAWPIYYPVKRSCVEKYGDQWTKPGNMVNNGPFLLKEWTPGRRIRLVKNPLYWDKANVKLNLVDVLPTEDQNTALNIYLTGKADWVDTAAIPLHLIPELKGRPDFHRTTAFITYFYRFNVTRPPFDDARVRKAFDMAIDKQRISDKILRAGQPIATTLVPPTMPNYTPPKGLPYNSAEARRLLAEAGYPEGKGFPKVSILFNTMEAHKQIAVEIQAMWEKSLGIEVQLENQEWGTYLNSVDNLDYDVARSSWIADYPDPNTFLDMFVTGGGNNRTGWSNKRYDELIARAAKERDQHRRMEFFQEAEKILVEEEMPIMPIYFYVVIELYDDSRIDGICPNPLNLHPLKYIFTTKSE